MVALLVATPLIPSESASRLGTHAVLVMAWFVIAAVSLAHDLGTGRGSGRWEPLDWLVALFLVLWAASALVMLHQGHARATLNALWIWLASGLLYACVRRRFVRRAQQRALASVLLALAVGLSVFGFYQVGVRNPQLRADYARNPERVLRSEGIDLTPGSPERQQFENRVASVEPIATFALTNSLAGLLVPSLVLWLFVIASFRPRHGGGRLVRVGLWLSAGVVSACLILTKSRTAFVAVPLGAVLLVVQSPMVRAWVRWRTLVAIAVVLALLLAVAVRFGGVDRQVITEAPKSLLYRWQYWEATVAMMRDYPWFGCGPGNFQTWYTRYKAPVASETVADPHNFLLEIAATAGAPAAVCFVALLVTLAGTRRRTSPPAPAVPAVDVRDVRDVQDVRDASDAQEALDARRAVRGIYGGMCAGFVLAYPAAWAGGMAVDPVVLFLACPAAIVSLGLTHGWVCRGALPVRVVLAATAALLVNLLAAGGISYPGVGQQVWWLAALATNARRAPGATGGTAPAAHQRRAVWRASVQLGVVVLLGLACYVTMYRPVLKGRHFLLLAQSAATAPEAERQWISACDVDPWSGEAWELRADLAARTWLAHPSDAGEARFLADAAQLRQRDRNSSRVERLCGDWALSMFAVSPRPRLGEEVIRAYESAVKLYPNSAILHAQLAWAYHVLGRADQAWEQTREARRLDDLMPHAELRLARQRLTGSQFAAPGTAPTEGAPELNAEQLLSQIRKVMNP